MSKRRLSLCCTAITLCLLLAGCVTLDFSPDGKQLVFTWSTQVGQEGLFVAYLDGSGLRALPDIEDAETALWSPDGRYILVADQYWEQKANQQVQFEKLKLYDTRTHETRTIADHTGSPFAWSPDGSRFVATGFPSENHPILRWFQMPEDRLISTTPLPSIQKADSIRWLPDPDSLALMASTAKSRDIYRVQASHVQRITTTGDVIGLGLSADKQRLLWARAGVPSARSQINFGNPSLLRLFSYDLHSRSVAKLPLVLHLPPLHTKRRLATPEVLYVDFSPDGQRLLLITTADPLPGKKRKAQKTIDPHSALMALYTLRIDGTQIHLLQTGLAQKAEYLSPSWSHDGQHLAVYKGNASSPSIYLYNADGSDKYRMPLPAWPQNTPAKAAVAHETRRPRRR